MNAQVDPETLRIAPYPHDEHLDGDADGLGAMRGLFFCLAVMAVLVGGAVLIF